MWCQAHAEQAQAFRPRRCGGQRLSAAPVAAAESADRAGTSTHQNGQLTPAQAGTCPPETLNLAEQRIRRMQVIGGLTPEYYVAA